MKAASVAKVLQELEDEGLVVKVAADDDGRLMEVAPTPAGRTLATLVTQDISDLFERVFWRKIPRSELGNLEQGIVDFLEHIGVDTNKIARESASVMSPQFLHSPYQTVRRWKRELEGEPVTFAEYRVLSLMRAQRGVVPSDAARQLCLKRSQVSLILKSLVRKGACAEGAAERGRGCPSAALRHHGEGISVGRTARSQVGGGYRGCLCVYERARCRHAERLAYEDVLRLDGERAGVRRRMGAGWRVGAARAGDGAYCCTPAASAFQAAAYSASMAAMRWPMTA